MTAPTIRELQAVDRCDRCGARSCVALQLKSGAELQFCGHHYTEHAAKLTLQGALIVGQNGEAD
jgi:hypothetical protein